jgi:O-antigen ligase
MHASVRASDATVLLAASLLAATMFLLSADLLFVPVAGHKIKLGYFLVPAMWLTAPGAMRAAVGGAVRRVPWYAWLPLLPLAVSVATSTSPRDSLAWTAWLAFDLFTVATVFAFATAHAFPLGTLGRSLTASLAAIMLLALAQFVAIYVFGHVVFSPQSHFDVYRINGVAGWPHFLNVYAFLLLPIVLVQPDLRWTGAAVVALLMFVLVQSTAKTGWVLFLVMGGLLLLLDRRLFVRRWLLFLVPVTAVALMVPTPSFTRDVPAIRGAEKVERFSEDLDLADATTSGTDRVLIGKMGVTVFLRHPWFGVGPRAYDDYVRQRFDAELPGTNKLDANQSVIVRNENIWIEFLAENGILFTLAFALVVVRALYVPRWAFANRLHMGSWIALVLYFAASGQFSQTGLLTMVYALFGIYFYAAGLAPSGLPSDPGSRAAPRGAPAG